MTILAGITPSDEGSVSVRKDIRVGYLDQAPDFPDEFPVMEVLFSGNNPTAQIVKEYEHALHIGDNQKLMDTLEQMDALQAWDFGSQSEGDFGEIGNSGCGQTMGTLSGGQKKCGIG